MSVAFIGHHRIAGKFAGTLLRGTATRWRSLYTGAVRIGDPLSRYELTATPGFHERVDVSRILTFTHIIAMVRFPVLFLLAASAIANAQAPKQPSDNASRPGFRPNAGQYDSVVNRPYDSGVLFALQSRLFYRNAVQLSFGLTLEFVNAGLAVTVSGESQFEYPLNIYYGPRAYWRENVPQFASVRYAQIYPGIELEWFLSSDAGTQLRVVV